VISLRFQRGIQLPEHDLWLDPWDSKPRAFVSHAHSDHIAAHGEIITTPATAQLMLARLPGTRIEHLLEFGNPAQVGDLQVTLIPAGHILGSAQILIEESRGSLLYTGDFKLRPGLSAEPAEWRHAQTLVMETTYGLPRYRFPPTHEVIARLVAFCQEALEENAVPVLLGYSLGKAQEILCALTAAGLTPMLHGAVHRMTRLYQKLRPDFPCAYEKYAAGEVAGKVLICPPSSNRSPMITRIKNRRVAVITGWALDPGATYRYGCDEAFPLSDHADYPDLIRHVELVCPERVLTLHGFATEFARDLRERGIEAWSLTAASQLELTLRSTSGGPRPAERPAQIEVQAGSRFGEFAELGERLAAIPGKLKKIELLRDFFRNCTAEELPIVAIYLTGKPFSQSASRKLQAGWAIIHRALLAVSGVGEVRLREIARGHADASRTALDALHGATSPRPFSLAESQRFFDELQQARGPLAKTELLQSQLATLTPLEGAYVVKILTGDLRIGLKEGLVEEAIAAAFDVPADAVREAHMLLGDIGETARRAANGTLHEAELRLFTPIKCMLASPEPSAEAIWARIQAGGLSSCWIEDKFDGIRAQLHRGRDRVEIFTRDLKRVTGQFDELAESARNLPAEAIFDGEIVAHEHGRKLSFFDLQKRLGRTGGGDLFLGSEIPVQYIAFDLLWLNGRSLLKETLRKRRTLLDELALPARFRRAEVSAAASAAEIDAAFVAARARRNEGLIVKDPESLYTPGRRGLAWLKLKKEFATLDVVVVGVEFGHGKRRHVLSDYTFAVRDLSTGRLLPIGKAYSGLTDLEIEKLTAHFKATTIAEHGRYREVTPEIVLEIAFDSVQPSTRHESGLALRFPRIKAIRSDKTPADIDSLDYARSLVGRGG
jgi:DNA ligase-1